MHWDIIFKILGVLAASIGLVAYVRRAKKNEHIISQQWPHRFARGYELTPMQLRHDFASVVGWFKDRRKSYRQRQLDRLREKLRDKIDELARLEEVMATLHPNTTIEGLVRFMNRSWHGHWGHLFSSLFLDPKNDVGLIPWLRRHADQDVVKALWYVEPKFVDAASAASDLQSRLISQQNLWRKQRDSLRRDCMQHQQVIEMYEKSLGIVRPETPPEASGKRAQLKKLRAQLTEIRLEEERLEQDILDDENRGADAPHRRKAGVSTDTD